MITPKASSQRDTWVEPGIVEDGKSMFGEFNNTIDLTNNTIEFLGVFQVDVDDSSKICFQTLSGNKDSEFTFPISHAEETQRARVFLDRPVKIKFKLPVDEDSEDYNFLEINKQGVILWNTARIVDDRD